MTNMAQLTNTHCNTDTYKKIIKKTTCKNLSLREQFYHSKLTFSRTPYDKCHQGDRIQDAAGP
jgi:hypothetical protein